MTTAWTASAGFTVGADALNAASLTATDAIGATLSAGNSVAAGPVQQEVLAANLAPSAAIRSRATQVYGIMQPGFAAQDDVVEVLGLSLH
jgi:HAMP domain-containing protein